MSKVVIFGVGELAQVAAVYLEADSPHQIVAFAVDAAYSAAKELLGKPVIPFEDLPRLYPPEQCQLFIAVGYKGLNQARAEVFQRCKALGYRCISYVCSKTVQWGHVEIGENCFIFENNVLQPFTRIGDNCVLWTGNFLAHHARIGNHCFLTSHVVVSGGTTIGDYCFVGANATLGDHIRIAPRCVIGAGALVVRDTEEGGVYLGAMTPRAKVSIEYLRTFQLPRKSA
jgi:sugar O-acyltransferase (sialic acid O-acetyltransferase NeuD family)